MMLLTEPAVHEGGQLTAYDAEYRKQYAREDRDLALQVERLGYICRHPCGYSVAQASVNDYGDHDERDKHRGTPGHLFVFAVAASAQNADILKLSVHSREKDIHAALIRSAAVDAKKNTAFHPIECMISGDTR